MQIKGETGALLMKREVMAQVNFQQTIDGSSTPCKETESLPDNKSNEVKSTEKVSPSKEEESKGTSENQPNTKTTENQSSVRVSERLRFKNKLKASKKLLRSHRGRTETYYPPVELASVTIESGNPAHKLMFLHSLGLIPNHLKLDPKVTPPFVQLQPLPYTYTSKNEKVSTSSFSSLPEDTKNNSTENPSIYSNDPEVGDLDLEVMYCPLDIPEIYEQITKKPFPYETLSVNLISSWNDKSKNCGDNCNSESGYESVGTPVKSDLNGSSEWNTPEKIPYYLNQPSKPKEPRKYFAKKSTAKPPPPQPLPSTNKTTDSKLVRLNRRIPVDSQVRTLHHNSNLTSPNKRLQQQQPKQHIKLNNYYNTIKTIHNHHNLTNINKSRVKTYTNPKSTTTMNKNNAHLQNIIRHQQNSTMKIVMINGKKVLVRSINEPPGHNNGTLNRNPNTISTNTSKFSTVPQPQLIGIHPITKKPIYRVHSSFLRQNNIPLKKSQSIQIQQKPRLIQVPNQIPAKLQKDPEAPSSLNTIMQRLQACNTDIEFLDD